MAETEPKAAEQHGRLAIIGPAEVELWRFIEQLALMILDPPEISYLSPEHPNLLAWEGIIPPPELRSPDNIRIDLYSVPADPYYAATLEFILNRVDRVLFLVPGHPNDRKAVGQSAAYLQEMLKNLGNKNELKPAALFVDSNKNKGKENSIKINELPFAGTPCFIGDLSTGENCFTAFLAAIKGLIPELETKSGLPGVWPGRPATGEVGTQPSLPEMRDSSIGSTKMFPLPTGQEDPQMAEFLDQANHLLAGNEINDSLKQSLRVDLERQEEISDRTSTFAGPQQKKPPAPEEALHAIGEVLFDYTIEKIMQGGLAYVYVAHNPRKKPAHIAIKTFRGLVTEAQERDTFLAEVQRTIALDPHPNLVKSFWGEVRNGRPYLLMEYVEGGSARSMLLQNKDGLHPLQAVQLALETSNGLAFLWESAQLIHADLKPENILMDRRAGAKVTDLGLAANATITQGGLGTPPYMSPEQWLGDKIDTRTDIYAFGVFLFEILTARWPFLLPDEPKREDFEDAHCFNDPVTLAEYFPHLGEELSVIVEQCLNKKPEFRFQDFRVVIERLQKIHHQMTGHNHPLSGPGKPGAVEFLARAAIDLRGGRLEQAKQNAGLSIQAEPRRAEAFVMRGAVQQALNNRAGAFDDYRRALDLDPYNSRAWFNQALAHEDAREWGQAEACYRRVTEIDPIDAAAWIRRGAMAEELGELQESFACLTNAWEVDPSDWDCGLNLAQMQLRLGRPARAVEWLMELEQMDLRDPRAALFMGQAELMMGLPMQAENSFQRALLQDPEDPLIWMWRSILLHNLARHADAEGAILKARMYEPEIDAMYRLAVRELSEWWTKEAARLAKGGDLVEAADRIAAAISVVQDSPEVLLWNRLLFRALGSPHKEDTALSRLAEGGIDPALMQTRQNELIGQLEVQAREAFTNRQFGRARAMYTAILNLDPNRKDCSFELWQCLLGMGDLPAATRLEREILDAMPDQLWRMQKVRDQEAVNLIRLGEELVKAGMDGMAKEQFSRAVVLHGSHPLARFWLQIFDGPGQLAVAKPLLYDAQAIRFRPLFQQIATRWREAMMMAVDAQEWENARLFAERIMRLGQANPRDEEVHQQAMDNLGVAGDAEAPAEAVKESQHAARSAEPPREPPPDPDDLDGAAGDTSSVIL